MRAMADGWRPAATGGTAAEDGRAAGGKACGRAAGKAPDAAARGPPQPGSPREAASGSPCVSVASLHARLQPAGVPERIADRTAAEPRGLSPQGGKRAGGGTGGPEGRAPAGWRRAAPNGRRLARGGPPRREGRRSSQRSGSRTALTERQFSLFSFKLLRDESERKRAPLPFPPPLKFHSESFSHLSLCLHVEFLIHVSGERNGPSTSNTRVTIPVTQSNCRLPPVRCEHRRARRWLCHRPRGLASPEVLSGLHQTLGVGGEAH